VTASLLLVAAALAAQPPAAPVQVANPSMAIDGQGQLTVAIDVVNRTDQAVTAWNVAYTILFADGSSVPGGFGMDGVWEFAGTGVRPGSSAKTFVPPQSTLHATSGASVSFPDKQNVASIADVKLTYAIFADGTSTGDPALVKAAFKQRGRWADAFEFMASILRDAQAAGATPDSLRVALDRLNAKDQPDVDDGFKQWQRNNIQLLLDGRVKEPPAQALERWIGETEKHHWVYDAHRFPHPTPVVVLDVLNPVITEDREGYQYVDFDLRNVSDQAVVDWSIRVTVKLSDGSLQTSGYGRDGLMSYAGVGPKPDSLNGDTVVPAHATVRSRFGYMPQRTAARAVSVTDIDLRHVILADDSWSGDEKTVESEFERRAKSSDAIAFILPVLRKVLDDGGTNDAVLTALVALRSKDQPDANNFEKQVTRTNLNLLLEGRITETPEAFLKRWISYLEARRVVYEAHRQPKENGPGSP
jgi:hypothetical protein